MKRKTKFVIFMGLLAIFFLGGCFVNEESQADSSLSDITIEEAQKCFESTVKTFYVSPPSKSRSTDEELLVTPLWEEAAVLDFEKKNIVEIPIEAPAIAIHQVQSIQDSIPLKDRYINTSVSLIAEKGVNGEIFFTVAKLTSEGNFLKRHKKKPKKLLISKVGDFSGVVRYYNLQGEFISGYRYRDGKKIASMALVSETQTRLQTRAQEWKCTQEEYRHEEYICTEIYYGGELCGTHCELDKVWYETVETCDWVDVPDPDCPYCGENPCVCGQGGGGGTGGETGEGEPVKPDPETVVTLSSTASVIEAPNRYNLNVTVTNAKQKILKVTYDMNRSTIGTSWKTVYEDSPSGYSSTYSRIAWTPGLWEVKAIVDFGTEKRESNTISVEEQYPSRSCFDNNSSLKTHLSTTLWNMCVQFAQNNQSTHEVREYGCFIYLRRNGTYYAGPTIDGPKVAMIQPGIAGSVSFPYNDLAYEPTMDDVDLLVGTMHTHYPMTWAAKDIYRPIGPSGTDLAASLPGIGYDYIEDVSEGHDINAEKDYFYHGPDKRATTY